MTAKTRCLPAGLTLALGALAGLAALTVAMAQGGTQAFDRWGLETFAALRTPGADAFFLTLTWLGSGWLLAPAALLIALYLAARRHRAAAVALGLGYFGAALTTWLLKSAIARERPPAPLVEIAAWDWSFPSSHATQAAAFALGMWLLTGRFRPRWRTAAGVVLAGLVLLVAASRLHLQAHWPSDVAAGLLVAILWAGLALAATRQPGIKGGTP
jgi:undecaprenyl-diphosphatase